MHHERVDGSGYHRGSGRADLPVPARLLAAADAYQAMTQPRLHRAALTPERVAAELEEGAAQETSSVASSSIACTGASWPRRQASAAAASPSCARAS